MNKEGFNPYQAHEKRIDFIENAVGEGVLDKIPVSERDQNIALVYYLNDRLSGEKIGNIFPQSSGKPLGKESVRQKGQQFLTAAYNAASPQLQAKHTLEELFVRKPSALREATSLIKSALERDIDPRSIGLPTTSLTTARKTLLKRGVEVPLILNFADFKKRVEKAGNDDIKLQEILDYYEEDNLIRYYGNHKEDEEKVLTNFSNVLRNAGFYFPFPLVKFFAEKLKEIDNYIPLRYLRSSNSNRVLWLLYFKDQQRIIDDLKDVPDLQKFRTNPVQLVCGTFDGKIPTITAFQKKTVQQYRHLSNLAYCTIGFKSTRRPMQNLSTLVEGCPIPVFRNGGSFIYPMGRQEEMETFLKSKQEKI